MPVASTAPALDAEDATGDVAPVRDPTMIYSNGRYIIYSTDPPRAQRPAGYLPIRCSSDRIKWSACGYVFSSMPAWIRSAVPGARNLWAPDISYFHGEYHLYYSASSLRSQSSAIGQATNASLDPADARYRWVDRGLVLASRQGDDFNAIDPNIVIGGAGDVRLTYGSAWSGIKQREIDGNTGSLSNAVTARIDLAASGMKRDEVVEGASILHHAGFYYLFLSKGACCEADLSRDDYHQVVGRSPHPGGPFVDAAGTRLLDGGGSLLLQSDKQWAGPGGGSAVVDPKTREDILVYHALNRATGGTASLRISRILWPRGWPVLVPASAAP